MESCQTLYGEQIEIWNVQPGDVVADIGAYDGYLDGVISMFSDSATIYIQDIDSSAFWVFREKLLPHFNMLRGKPITNQFRYVQGTYDTTNLPHDAFDKILLNNVLHYIGADGETPEEREANTKKVREEFLQELHILLKDSGYLYIRTPLARNELETHFIFAEDDLVNLVTQQKYQFKGDFEVLQGMNYIFKFQKSDRNGRKRY